MVTYIFNVHCRHVYLKQLIARNSIKFINIYSYVFIAYMVTNHPRVLFTRATDFVFMAGYGMSQPVGHLDFYPNNGKEQPGCDLTEGPLVPLTLVKQGLEEASRVLVACNHVRAIKLFTESINGKCSYIGKKHEYSKLYVIRFFWQL